VRAFRCASKLLVDFQDVSLTTEFCTPFFVCAAVIRAETTEYTVCMSDLGIMCSMYQCDNCTDLQMTL